MSKINETMKEENNLEGKQEREGASGGHSPRLLREGEARSLFMKLGEGDEIGADWAERREIPGGPGQGRDDGVMEAIQSPSVHELARERLWEDLAKYQRHLQEW